MMKAQKGEKSSHMMPEMHKEMNPKASKGNKKAIKAKKGK